MDQGTILSEFQRDIEEIKIAALKCEKAIEEENSQKQLTPLIVEEIPVHEPVKEVCRQNTMMEELLDNDLLDALGDLPPLNDAFYCTDCDGVTLCSVCAEIETCLKGDDVQVTNIFNGNIDIHDEVKNVSDIGQLEKNNCEVENNVLVEVDELKNMKSSKSSVDLNENFDSSMVCVDSVVRDCALLPIDKEYEKEEIIVDYVHQFLPSPASIIQLPSQSQLELVHISHGYFLGPHQYALVETDYQLQIICDMQYKSHVESTTVKKSRSRAFQWTQRDGIHEKYKDEGQPLRSIIWNPKLLLWIFIKQFQRICHMMYKVWDRGKTCFHKHWWRFLDEFKHKPP
ncbi:hypothetical protein PIB30_013280 [Stylosanthes scabra]|uniref:Uncharacterized protein n=1 Tax=Stylosanthes scabra TaxID=79078 RepID=A0ABU6S7R6_9FABA|nr:hypothetical protein [Stylosanthes scabra]